MGGLWPGRCEPPKPEADEGAEEAEAMSAMRREENGHKLRGTLAIA